MLQGERQLRARLRAIRGTFKPVAKGWGDDTTSYARGHVPVKTGRTQASIRVSSATTKKVRVVGRFTVNFIDTGTKEHTEKAKKRKAMRYGTGDSVQFAKRVRHPKLAARPFKRAAAEYGLKKNPMAVELIRQWNSAA